MGLIIVILISFGNLKAQCVIDPWLQDCYNSNCNSSITWTSASRTLTLPDWPNCPIIVEYCWRQCLINPYHMVQHHIKSISVPDIPECTALKDYINVEQEDLASHNLTYVKQQVQNQLTLNIFETFWQALPAQEKEQYRCPEGPSMFDPNANNWRIRYFFEEGACQAWCRFQQTIGNDIFIRVIPHRCSESVCCKIKIMYCVIDPTQNPPEVHMLKSYEGQPFPCDTEENPTIPGCYGEEVTIIKCRSTCQEKQFYP